MRRFFLGAPRHPQEVHARGGPLARDPGIPGHQEELSEAGDCPGPRKPPAHPWWHLRFPPPSQLLDGGHRVLGGSTRTELQVRRSGGEGLGGGLSGTWAESPRRGQGPRGVRPKARVFPEKPVTTLSHPRGDSGRAGGPETRERGAGEGALTSPRSPANPRGPGARDPEAKTSSEAARTPPSLSRVACRVPPGRRRRSAGHTALRRGGQGRAALVWAELTGGSVRLLRGLAAGRGPLGAARLSASPHAHLVIVSLQQRAQRRALGAGSEQTGGPHVLQTDGEPQTDARAGGGGSCRGSRTREARGGGTGAAPRLWPGPAGPVRGQRPAGVRPQGRTPGPPCAWQTGLVGVLPSRVCHRAVPRAPRPTGGQRVPWTLRGPGLPSEAGPMLGAPPPATRLLPSMRGRARLRAGGHAVCQDPGHELPSWVAVAAV